MVFEHFGAGVFDLHIDDVVLVGLVLLFEWRTLPNFGDIDAPLRVKRFLDLARYSTSLSEEHSDFLGLFNLYVSL